MIGVAKTKVIFHRGRRPRVGSLRGWWKALPLLALPFSVVFTEAWLQTQVLTLQYRANRLKHEIREVEGNLDSLQDRRHDLVRIDRINAKAPDLGLGVPNPGQLESILDPDSPPLLSTKAEAIASVIVLPDGAPDKRSARWNSSATLRETSTNSETIRPRQGTRRGSGRASDSPVPWNEEGAPLENLVE